MRWKKSAGHWGALRLGWRRWFTLVAMSNPSPPPGQRFRAALRAESPLQIVGAINANHALLAQRAGFRALYLSGGGVVRWACRIWASTPWMMF